MEQDTLYSLLPAFYRARDLSEGEPLRALCTVMEKEFRDLERDLDTLHENWFIETCEEWTVAYIADLLGIRGLRPGSPGIFSQRAFVANSLGYRRRKGTALMLEQLARDASGWPARAAEYFEHLSTNQNPNHVRLNAPVTADLRDAERSELAGSPFENTTHTFQMTLPATGGRYSIPAQGIHLWRLQSYRFTDVEPRKISSSKYTVHRLGLDMPLYNIPHTRTDFSHFAEEIHLPVPLRRLALQKETESLRLAVVNGRVSRPVYFDANFPVFTIQIEESSEPGAFFEIPPEEILISDLQDWQTPPESLTYKTFAQGTTTSVSMPIRVALDPELGRLKFPSSISPTGIKISCAFGAPGDLGGGPYNRYDTVYADLPKNPDWHGGVMENPDPVSGELLYPDLNAAIDAWNEFLTGKTKQRGLITIMDSRTYDLNFGTEITLNDGSVLHIVAARWPVTGKSLLSAGERKPGQIVPESVYPLLSGNLSIRNTTGGVPGSLTLNGLFIAGRVKVEPGDLGELHLSHCTLLGATPQTTQTKAALSVASDTNQGENENLSIYSERCIIQGLDVTVKNRIYLQDTIVQTKVAGKPALNVPNSFVALQTCTVLGESRMRIVEAGNTIFTETVIAERRQEGCVRFCYVNESSLTPQNFRCQPETAIRDFEEANPDNTDSDAVHLIRARMRPVFRSENFGDPDYAYLSRFSAPEIRSGAEDESEMGAFSFLRGAQREANIKLALKDYLRFGREPVIIFET